MLLEDTSDPSFKAKFDVACRKHNSLKVTFAVFNAYFDMSNQLVLAAPVPLVAPDPDRNYPEGRDRFEARLAPIALMQLTAQGVKDPRSYFRFKTIHAKGKARTSIYSSFPAIFVRYLFVENLADMEVIED